jgi:diguanylate cyclase (GGDEF)-like protein
MFDIDNFKHYNDVNGHPAGDDLLTEFGQILVDQLRKTDVPCRYGGEEFILILPETAAEESIAIAERVRSTMENTPFKYRERQPLGKISISAGIATYPINGINEQQLVDFADKGLYTAKKSGRNRVCVGDGTV